MLCGLRDDRWEITKDILLDLLHKLFYRVILLSKLLCTPHILEYAAALNIIFPKNSSFIFEIMQEV
ncbi:hypothetical protein Sarmat_00508 [Rickettsiales endosymbiont of Paramecium tredecaurelia]|nr:hypothetical protein [Candidatus Sarmatiella mevalonica]